MAVRRARMSYVNTFLNDNNVNGFGGSIKYHHATAVFRCFCVYLAVRVQCTSTLNFGMPELISISLCILSHSFLLSSSVHTALSHSRLRY